MSRRRNECDKCWLAACDLPDGVPPEEVFEVTEDGEFCKGCLHGRFEYVFEGTEVHPGTGKLY